MFGSWLGSNARTSLFCSLIYNLLVFRFRHCNLITQIENNLNSLKTVSAPGLVLRVEVGDSLIDADINWGINGNFSWNSVSFHWNLFELHRKTWLWFSKIQTINNYKGSDEFESFTLFSIISEYKFDVNANTCPNLEWQYSLENVLWFSWVTPGRFSNLATYPTQSCYFLLFST